MILKEVLDRTQNHFRKKGLPTARLDAELLLAEALDLKRIDLYLKHDYPLAEEELSKCREYVRRRAEGEPCAYILGTKGFYKSDFVVNSSVLIPRPETELLVEKSVEIYGVPGDLASKNQFSIIQALRIADFGSGSGCVGLSLALEFPKSKVYLVDNSSDALEVSRVNAKNLSLEERVEFVNSKVEDWSLETSDASDLLDLVVANPPYIDSGDSRLESNVKKFEPNSALFAEQAGYACLFDWSQKAADLLTPGGHFLCEFGEGQAPRFADYLNDSGSWAEVDVCKDLSGIERVVVAKKIV